MGRFAAGLIVASCMLVLSPCSALAAQRYAAPNGGGGTCTALTPCQIQIAINSANTGDEVIIAGDQGSYGTPGSPITTALDETNAINVHGAAGQPRPVVYSNTAAAYALSLNNPATTLSNLEIQHVGANAGLFTNGSFDRVVARGGNVGCQPGLASAVISNSVCSGDSYGIHGNANTGSPQTLTLRNVTAIGNTVYGIFLKATNFSLTVNATNVIAQGGLDDIATDQMAGAVNVNLNNSNYLSENSTSGTVVTAPGSGTNQAVAPLFVNAPGHDFHPVAGSPTIDTGLNDPLNGTTDVDGRPRIIHAVTDIGAFEFLPPPEATTGTASQVTAGGALIAGSTNPNGQTSSYHLEYGTTTAYGQSTPTQTLPVGIDTISASAALGGLASGVTYHFRMVATNASGTTNGADATFTTVDNFSGVTFVSKSATVKKGVATVKVKCPSGTPSPCAGTLTLDPTGKTSKKAKRFGSKKFSVEAGKTTSVKVKLSSGARKSLTRKGRLKARASVTATDGAGLSKKTSKTLTLKLAKKRK